MALKRLSTSPTETTRLERILIYADPKCGKTRLATSLPEHFGEAVYVAWDPGTEHLGPVLAKYRSRLHPIQSTPKIGEPYEPDKDAFSIALTDWTTEWPHVKTLIWDNITATAEDLLSHVADTAQFSSSHVKINTGKSHLNLPMEGDYGAVHGMIDRLTTYLFRQPLHLIILAHAQIAESKDGSGTLGGPATIGKASVRKYAGRFDTVIHLATKTKDGKQSFTAHMDKHANIWTGGIRSHLALNPMPSTDLEPDPISFWNKYLQHFSVAD